MFGCEKGMKKKHFASEAEQYVKEMSNESNEG